MWNTHLTFSIFLFLKLEWVFWKWLSFRHETKYTNCEICLRKERLFLSTISSRRKLIICVLFCNDGNSTVFRKTHLKKNSTIFVSCVCVCGFDKTLSHVGRICTLFILLEMPFCPCWNALPVTDSDSIFVLSCCISIHCRSVGDSFWWDFVLTPTVPIKQEMFV